MTIGSLRLAAGACVMCAPNGAIQRRRPSRGRLSGGPVPAEYYVVDRAACWARRGAPRRQERTRGPSGGHFADPCRRSGITSPDIDVTRVALKCTGTVVCSRVREPPMPWPPTGDRGWMARSAGVGSAPLQRIVSDPSETEMWFAHGSTCRRRHFLKVGCWQPPHRR